MDKFEELLLIARRKSVIDENNEWFNGAETYLSSLKDEIDEVVEALKENKPCYAEDELGDILWNVLNLFVALDKESRINFSSLMERVCKKYEERISGIESGESWFDIKSRQRIALDKEYESSYPKS